MRTRALYTSFAVTCMAVPHRAQEGADGRAVAKAGWRVRPAARRPRWAQTPVTELRGYCIDTCTRAGPN